jgi:hypothetical protein
MHHVTRVCATSGECQDQPVFVHVKRVTLRIITVLRRTVRYLVLSDIPYTDVTALRARSDTLRKKHNPLLDLVIPKKES